ncbi:hypothetical protein SAMN05421639_102362 [Chryseobacterium shigense]|uniref:Uncharacterized protein n=1 Tax=Chryseobacterium shigense TaxID=297244 RepID=A0A1N7I6Q5_9FLAO|nr:hypothetical protein [Chryseobacterium shigense]SIS32749.1 hypothetical protein SAMN05421639_102362 [Chryseobacterium shigense]
MKNCFYTLLVIIAALHWSNAETFTLETGNRKLSASLQIIPSDTVKIKESFRENDIAINEYLTDRLKPIRTNFKRINSITQWSSIKKKDIEGESAEGGEAVFYEQKGRLEKITARLYGEMGQVLTEYYLLNGHLSFVFEKVYTYNRPLFYDVKVMKENHDTEAFDFKKSEIEENRNYFEKGKLVHIIHSLDCGAPFSSDYIEGEQERISEAFQKLLQLRKEK